MDVEKTEDIARNVESEENLMQDAVEAVIKNARTEKKVPGNALNVVERDFANTDD